MRYCRFFLSGFFVFIPNLLCTTATTIICRFFGPTRSSRDLLWKLKTFVLFFVFSTVSKTFTNARTRVSLIIGACYIIHSYTLSTTVVRHFFIIIIISTRTRDRMIFADSNSDRSRRAFYRRFTRWREAFMTTSAIIFQCALFYSHLSTSTTLSSMPVVLESCCRAHFSCAVFFYTVPAFTRLKWPSPYRLRMYEGEVALIFHTHT